MGVWYSAMFLYFLNFMSPDSDKSRGEANHLKIIVKKTQAIDLTIEWKKKVLKEFYARPVFLQTLILKFSNYWRKTLFLKIRTSISRKSKILLIEPKLSLKW